MYAAKANGKGCIEMFEPSMHLKAVDRLSIRGELERSVDRGEIAVVYQPIVQLGSLKLVGFEALARRRHPARGAISPVEFIRRQSAGEGKSGCVRAITAEGAV